jgi:L-malate glycosyltransferase
MTEYQDSPSILFVTNLYPSEQKPYLGTFVKSSVDSLRFKGRIVDVVALRQDKPKLLAYLLFYNEIARKLVSYSGIVYVHYVTHSVLPVLLAMFLNSGFKVVLHFHGSDAFPEASEGRIRRKLKEMIAKSALKRADKIVVPSAEFKSSMVQEYKLGQERVYVSPSGGVDSSLFRENPSLRSEDTTTVLYASRMIPGKGVVLAAAAFKKAYDENRHKTKLVAKFVGEGPERAIAEEILDKEISSGVVEFLDLLDQRELVRLFQAADIFLFPSTRKGESLGLVLIEAIYCGAVPLAIDNLAARSILNCASTIRILAADKTMFVDKLQALLGSSKEDLKHIHEQLLKVNRKYDSSLVAEELSEILN